MHEPANNRLIKTFWCHQCRMHRNADRFSALQSAPKTKRRLCLHHEAIANEARNAVPASTRGDADLYAC